MPKGNKKAKIELQKRRLASASDSISSIESVDIPSITPDILEQDVVMQQANDNISTQLSEILNALERLNQRTAEHDHMFTALTQRLNTNEAGPSHHTVPAVRSNLIGDPFRIPDPIKILPTFNGNKKQLQSWLDTAEKTLNTFQDLVSPEIFQIYLTAVTNKIEGYAKDILCTNGNPESFHDIKKILVSALGDKQELSTYNCQLWHNKMDGSVTKHYQKTKQIVQSIKTLAKQNPRYDAHWEAINEFIEEYSLAAYVSGLQKPYFGYAQAAGPKTLEDAYAFVCKFTSNEATRKINQTEPPKKDRFDNKIEQHKNFNGKPQFTNNKFNKFENKRESAPPEPMEVGSVRSRLTTNKHVNNLETNSDDETEEVEENFCASTTTNVKR